jgi:hypothetical protein
MSIEGGRPTTAAHGGASDWLVEEDEHRRKESQARAKLAGEVATGLERTLKSFRQFGLRHRASQKFVEETTTRVGAFVASLEEPPRELPMSIVGSDILYDGDSIYSDPELRTSYPFLLFRDGIQRVVFEEGLEATEIGTICQLLRDQSLQGTNVAMEDDLVTLLWDADLKHVRYVVTEGFKHDDSDAEREAQRKRLIALIEADASAVAAPADVAARFVRPVRPADQARSQADLDVASAWEKGSAIVNDERARLALAGDVDSDDILLRKFLEIVFVEILTHKEAKVHGDLVALVRDFAVEAARRDRLAEAIGVLKALGELARLAGADGRKVAQEILGQIATPELLAELMHQLQIADEAGIEPLLTFLALMPSRESGRIVPLLPTVTEAARRRAVCQLLADRLGDDLAAVGEQIAAADEALALDLVYLLRSSRSPRARVELLLAIDHASPVVRTAAIEAIRQGASPSDPTLLGASLLMLDDPDPELRRLALYAIPRHYDTEAARRLRTVISRDAFDEWSYGDKRRAFLAYASAAGRRAARELVEVLGTHAMFSGEALDDRRCCAAFALAALSDEAHVGTLEAEKKRLFGGKRVKEACEAAVAILKFKRPVEETAPDLKTHNVLDDVRALDTSHLPKPIWEDAAAAPAASAPDAAARGAATGRSPAAPSGGAGQTGVRAPGPRRPS